MKKRRDSGVIHEWKDSELEGYVKGGIQDWRNSGLEG